MADNIHKNTFRKIIEDRIRYSTPFQMITISFICMIAVGTFFLNLPIASNSGESIGFLNALFTATSANCVTGLVVVNTLEQWTLFGQIIILILIQLGGIGFVSILTITMVVLRKKISLKNRIVIQASFNQNSIGGMVKLVNMVIKITFAIEAIGAILLTYIFYTDSKMGILEAIYKGIFHSVSAFCNAGFDIIGENSLMEYNTNMFLNVVIMLLIIAGGLGFPVWIELMEAMKNRKKKSWHIRWIHFSVHTKMTITITAALVFLGMLIFLLLEGNNQKTLGVLSGPYKWFGALFQSVTLRTCGFDAMGQANLHEISKFFSSLFMMVGGSSAGTAGGIKTATLGVIIIAMISVLKGKDRLEVFGRALPLDLLQKALTVTVTMGFVMLSSAFILHFTEQGSAFDYTFLDLLFETSSASNTVGITTGITPYLSNIGKAVIIVCMFVGRLSPITVVVALNMKLHATADSLSYPEERVIIG